MLFEPKEFFTVSELNALVRTLIEENYPEVAVLGEISNFKRHSSGHLYFTLKDAASQLRAVCFRGEAQKIDFEPEDGIKVLARGRLTVYEPYGQYQLVAYAIEKAGVGELEIAFRALMEKLEKEGLFDTSHKKALPPYPFKIAVVTSPTGAAVQDILSTLERRWPVGTVYLYPVHVQGPQAAPEIVRALGLLPSIEGIDLIILGRGGGSLEDLWAFNEEIVARAIYDCPVPIISAVGHETDFTIADFVADLRAATPTMAAEIAVPLKDEVIGGVDEKQQRLVKYVRGRIELEATRLDTLLRSYGLGRVRSQIEQWMQALDFTSEKLLRSILEGVRRRTSLLREKVTRLEGLDAKAILSRGYTICLDLKTGKALRSAARALEARDLQVVFADGRVRARVKEKRDG